jgi:hypothetical protein
LFGLGFYYYDTVSTEERGRVNRGIGSILAKIHINFIGPLRVFFGAKSITVDVNSIDEAKDYIETHYGPLYEKKLKSMGANKKRSIWDNSVFLLNGKNIGQVDEIVLKDGNKLDLMLLVAGG